MCVCVCGVACEEAREIFKTKALEQEARQAEEKQNKYYHKIKVSTAPRQPLPNFVLRLNNVSAINVSEKLFSREENTGHYLCFQSFQCT